MQIYVNKNQQQPKKCILWLAPAVKCILCLEDKTIAVQGHMTTPCAVQVAAAKKHHL